MSKDFVASKAAGTDDRQMTLQDNKHQVMQLLCETSQHFAVK